VIPRPVITPTIPAGKGDVHAKLSLILPSHILTECKCFVPVHNRGSLNYRHVVENNETDDVDPSELNFVLWSVLNLALDDVPVDILDRII
jgi:hypothetical protein